MVLIGVALIIIGFAFRLNSLVVVTVSGLVTGLIAGLPIKEIITHLVRHLLRIAICRF